MASTPPLIFDTARRIAARKRMATLLGSAGAAHYILDDMLAEVEDRLSFVRHSPQNALLIGDVSGCLEQKLASDGCTVAQADIAAVGKLAALELDQPYRSGGFDLIACFGLLDCVNDLPGALIHMHRALEPGGMVIASFIGAPSLPVLRQIMFAADGDRPAARIHPQVDVRAAAELIQRAGWSDPVVDSHTLTVRFSSLGRLVQDLRQQGLSKVLTSRAPALGKAAYQRALAAFDELADEDGKITERFEIITLTGRRR